MSVMRVLEIESILVDDSINVSRGGKPIVEQNVKGLSEDIKTHGLLENLGVAHVGVCGWIQEEQRTVLLNDGIEWVLVYGFRRIKACVIGGLTHVRVNDLGPLTRADAELANVAENGDREPPTDFDVTVACHRFVVTHKKPPELIAQRTGRSLKFVEDSVSIVSRVAPNILQLYRANCSKDMRRKMVDLAAIDGKVDRERFRKQQEQLDAWDAAEAQERRENPNAGFGRGGNGRKKAPTGIVNKRSLITASEKTLVAREFWNGKEWVPATPENKELAIAWLRWALNPDEPMPVR